jgi:hypothetical protein
LAYVTLKISQSSMKVIDATNVEPSVKAWQDVDERKQQRQYWNDEEHDPAQQRG